MRGSDRAAEPERRLELQLLAVFYGLGRQPAGQITVDSLPGVEQQIALADLWEEIAAFANTIPTQSLHQRHRPARGLQGQIVTILG